MVSSPSTATSVKSITVFLRKTVLSASWIDLVLGQGRNRQDATSATGGEHPLLHLESSWNLPVRQPAHPMRFPVLCAAWTVRKAAQYKEIRHPCHGGRRPPPFATCHPASGRPGARLRLLAALDPAARRRAGSHRRPPPGGLVRGDLVEQRPAAGARLRLLRLPARRQARLAALHHRLQALELGVDELLVLTGGGGEAAALLEEGDRLLAAALVRGVGPAGAADGVGVVGLDGQHLLELGAGLEALLGVAALLTVQRPGVGTGAPRRRWGRA